MGRHRYLGVSAALGALSLLAVPALAARRTAVWHDAIGDARSGAADIDSISVGSDGGVVTFRLTFADRSALTSDDSIGFLIDADDEPSTGVDGIDDVVRVGDGRAIFLDLTGLLSELPSAGVVRSDHGLGVSVDHALLGDTRRLVVAAVSTLESDGGAFDETDRDAFALATGRTIVRSSLTISPARAVLAAGTRVTAHVAVDVGDGRTVAPTTRTCRMTLAGAAVKPVAPCTWTIPRAAAGKRVAITARGTFGGAGFRAKALSVRVR